MSEHKKAAMVVAGGCCGLFILGFVVWAGIYFGIYHPLLRKDWMDSLCVVTAIEHYQTGYTATHLYTQYKLAVEVEGRVLPAYACESSENRSELSSYYYDNAYPYQYKECSKAYVQHGVCRSGQVFLPRWMCLGFKGIPQYQVGDTVECKYTVNGDKDAESFSYPRDGSDFIEVIFTSSLYIPQGDYIALWVIPFGLMSVLPCLVIWCCLGPVRLGWLLSEERDKVLDFGERFLLCRRKKRPRCLRAFGADLDKIEPQPILMWLFTIKKLPQPFPMKRTLVREIADYLA